MSLLAPVVDLLSIDVASFVLFFDLRRYRQTSMHRLVLMTEELGVFGSSLPSS